MACRWFALLLLFAAVPARADDLVSMNQVSAALAAGALPANQLGNVSVITQVGFGNVAKTTQTGTSNLAAITQLGNDFSVSILQTSQRDVAAVTQIGNGLGAAPITITQTGPAQSIVITQHR